MLPLSPFSKHFFLDPGSKTMTEKGWGIQIHPYPVPDVVECSIISRCQKEIMQNLAPGVGKQTIFAKTVLWGLKNVPFS